MINKSCIKLQEDVLFENKQINQHQINAWTSSKAKDIDILCGIFNVVYWH